MFGEEKQSEDLKAFEAELASLRPRADGLDPRWRFLLAQEAMLNHDLPGGEALEAGQFLCSRCGAASSGHDKRRWAWPAAFSAMTLWLPSCHCVAGPRRAASGRADWRGKHVARSEAVRRKQADPSSPFTVRDSPRRGLVPATDERPICLYEIKCSASAWNRGSRRRRRLPRQHSRRSES